MRYYEAWSCRFISIDPLFADYPFYTPYQYAGNKPINAIDLDGLEESRVTESNTTNSQQPSYSNSYDYDNPIESNGSSSRENISSYNSSSENLGGPVDQAYESVDQVGYKQPEEPGAFVAGIDLNIIYNNIAASVGLNYGVDWAGNQTVFLSGGVGVGLPLKSIGGGVAGLDLSLGYCPNCKDAYSLEGTSISGGAVVHRRIGFMVEKEIGISEEVPVTYKVGVGFGAGAGASFKVNHTHNLWNDRERRTSTVGSRTSIFGRQDNTNVSIVDPMLREDPFGTTFDYVSFSVGNNPAAVATKRVIDQLNEVRMTNDKTNGDRH